MADQITYTDKVQAQVNPRPVIEQFQSVDANEIKTVVNANAEEFNAGALPIDNDTFEVLTGTTSQELWEQNDKALLKARGTEVLGGTGLVTFTVGTTTFNVAATTGQIKDSTGYYSINYAGETGISLISTSVSSIYVYIDNGGVLRQQTTAPTRSEYREKLFLTRLALVSGTLVAQEQIANPSGQYTNLLRDYLSYVPSPKLGLAISPNANLTFQVAAGSIFELGTMNANDPDNPNQVTFNLQNPASFFYVNRNTTLGTGQTSINVTSYDNAGVETTLSNNRFKIMTVFKFNSGNHVVQNGQAQYSSLDAAQTAISTRGFVRNPIVENGTRIGWIIVQKNATDLTNTLTARFVQDNGSLSTSTSTVGALLSSNNLSDVADTTTARINLLDGLLNAAADRFLEQAVTSNLIEASVATTYTLDLEASRMWLLTLTADTTFTISALSNSTCAAFTVKLTGAFVPTLTDVNVYGDTYDGSVQNLLTFNSYRTAAGTQVNDLIITNLA